MTLKGLPESPLPPGSVVLTSLVSVLVSTAGLALLRCTRPSKVRQLQRAGAHYGGLPPCLLYNVLGIFGALLLFLGQVVGSFPMLMGVSTDDEGKAAAIVQCIQVLLCWAVERYRILGHALPMMQSCACALVWFGSTLVEWAGPRPYDNISLGLRSQVSGCDGGYRSPFLVYAAGYLTCITFGVLFLCCEEGGSAPLATRGGLHSVNGDSRGSLDSEPSAPVPKMLTCKALPVIYGVAISMSGIVFALGTSTNDMRWVLFGALLLVVAVVCAWEWLWCVEMPLGTWAPVSHCAATMAKLGQAHLVFRDFRWDPDTVYGILVMWRWPGLPLFLAGFFLLMAMVQVYSNTCTWRDWGSGAPLVAPSSEKGLSSEVASMSRSSRCLYFLQWMLLPVCMTCCVIGISMPLIETIVYLPEVTWLHDEAAIERFENSTRPGTDHEMKKGKSYIDLISSLYSGRLPCSALVVAYNSVIMPPLQFLGFVIVLLGKQRLIRISEETLQAIKSYLNKQAPLRFTNSFILMTIVGLTKLTAPAGKMEAEFTRGYGYFIGYCMSCLLLAWSLNLKLDCNAQELEAGINSRSRGHLSSRSPASDLKVHLSKEARMISEDTYDEDDAASDVDSEAGAVPGALFQGLCSKGWEVLAILGLLPVVVVSLYLGLTSPFLSFEYRLSGITVQKSEPSVFELWQSLGEKSRPLQYFAATTLVFMMVIWVMLLGLRVLDKSGRRPGSKPTGATMVLSALEQTARPWVLGHIWAFCMVLIYYIVSARNKATIEVCAHFPDQPIGMVALVVMGGSVYGLVTLGAQLVDPPKPGHKGSTMSLPGGIWLWGAGALAVGSFWLLILYSHGPTLDPEISTLEDVNTVLSKLRTVTNTRLQQKIPESAGDCQALWDHRIENGKALYASPLSEVHKSCRGEGPFVRKKGKNGRTDMEVTAKWATGLNTLEIMDVLILPPTNISAYTQEWNMTVRAKFSGLKVWLKVLLGDKEWIDDYMCCDNPFHFTIQASVQCALGYGFRPIELHVLHLDPIKFKHRVDFKRSQDFSASWDIDYGRSDAVEKMLRSYLTGKRGKLLIKNSDGSTTDPLASASNVLNNIVYLNTGQQCLFHS